MNPRRSSRARATHPAPPPAPPPAASMHQSASSSSSTSLSRPERATRSNHLSAASKPTRAAVQRSQSLDPDAADAAPTTTTTNTSLSTRQHRSRGREEVEDAALTGDELDDEGEEEVTRCICGHQDYPGLPAHRAAAKAAASARDDGDGAASASASAAVAAPGAGGSSGEPLSDDAGSLFIQCDECKVWQHGGCVGIMEEASSPDEYFCERCRKDLHSIVLGPHGQKSSQYLPVAGPLSSAGSITSRDSKAKDKKSKSTDTSPRTKRRTMNSRDAAYDEEEQLRRAIEESKEDTASVDESASRRGKRSRSASELNKQAAKRQRTGSPTPKPRRNLRSPSEEESKSKPAGANGVKKTRATRYQREKEAEPEPEPEKEAPEPVSRRKSRADRRKGEESEPPEPTPSKQTPNPPPSAPDTPSSTPVPKPTRKSGRPPARRGRLGRNQYTRDRDPPNGADSATNLSNSPRRDNPDSPTGANGPNGLLSNGNEASKASRPRYMNPNRTTMNDMRRRVAAILDFISRMQVEMAASGEQPARPADAESVTTCRDMAATLAKAEALVKGLSGANASASANGGAGDAFPGAAPLTSANEKEFKDLSSGEMIDVLTRGLFKWQDMFGKYGDK